MGGGIYITYRSIEFLPQKEFFDAEIQHSVFVVPRNDVIKNTQLSIYYTEIFRIDTFYSNIFRLQGETEVKAYCG